MSQAEKAFDIDLKDDLKKYKVKYYLIKDNVLHIDVKKKED